MTGPTPEQLNNYTALGQLIHDEAPYGDGTFDEQSVVIESAWLKDYDADHPITITPKEMTVADHEARYHWFVGDREQRITKALRVPYTFQRRLMENGQPVLDENGVPIVKKVTTFLIVGYEGPGH
jgi:hypothetical protein